MFAAGVVYQIILCCYPANRFQRWKHTIHGEHGANDGMYMDVWDGSEKSTNLR
jgi:hypothetical protein